MLKKNESLTEQITALANETSTPTSLSERALERAIHFKSLNAFVSLEESVVLAQAEKATMRRKKGRPLSLIDGIPIAVKDNYLTRDYPTTACSNAAPLEYTGVDATIVANLRAAGAVIFAKTNMHEWAYGATNNTSNIGITRNPHNPEHITGGSSGGSGAAVGAGIVAAALGSDTGGSVRIPSAACGIYGFKPSYGRASRHGVLPLSCSLDAPGPMTTALADIIHLLPYFFGVDPNDASTAHTLDFNPVAAIKKPKLVNLVGPGLERCCEVDRAIAAALSGCDVAVENSELANIGNYFAAWDVILHCEASAYHSILMKKNPAGFSPVTFAHLEAGLRLTAVELLAAQKLSGHMLNALISSLPTWDALILPTLPVPAPRHGDDWQEFSGRKVTTQNAMTWFCWLGNLAGLPCLTIPVAKSKSGLPIGMMLMGRLGRDEELLALVKKIDEDINGKSDGE